MPKALGSAPFDSEGVATRDRELVANGVLARLRAEHLLGAQARAADHGQRRRHAQPDSCAGASATSTACSRCMDRGLLVTELMGQGVNGVTGDYSRGAVGILGREWRALRIPVHEITIAGQPQGHVSPYRRRRQRRRPARRHAHGLDPDRGDDDRRRVIAARPITPARSASAEVARSIAAGGIPEQRLSYCLSCAHL